MAFELWSVKITANIHDLPGAFMPEPLLCQQPATHLLEGEAQVMLKVVFACAAAQHGAGPGKAAPPAQFHAAHSELVSGTPVLHAAEAQL